VWGLDVDLANAIGAELGLDVSFLYLGYDGLYDALDTKLVDVLISALVIQPERTKDFAYSTPYFNAGQVLIVRPNSPIEQIGQLTNERLAVELGAQGHVLATTWERRLPNLTVLPTGGVDLAIQAIGDGNADAALVDHVGGRLFLHGRTDLILLPNFVEDDPYALVVRAEDEQLLVQLNQALATVESSGLLTQITQKWLDQNGDN
jgi:polar amino acid transport system substrate-binding protein